MVLIERFIPSYSCFEIHICWKVERDAKIDPPIHTLYLRSGGATTLIFIEDGASAVISFWIRSAMPGSMKVLDSKQQRNLDSHLTHGGSPGQDNIGIQVLADIYITLHDGIENSLMYSRSFHTEETRLK